MRWCAVFCLLKACGTDGTNCINKHELCTSWASSGECETNPGYMKVECAPACNSCGWVDAYCNERNNGPAKTEGGITRMFQRAAQMIELGATVHSSDPWIMTFDNFLQEGEAEGFLETTVNHFERSLAGDVVSPVRTSQQAWCQMPQCVDDRRVNTVHERVVNVTGIPKENAEFFQVLHYEPGQFYKTHHDQNTHPDSLSGVRLFTFFIYLHAPESGGQTHFPNLNLTIQPVKGRAILWPNVYDHDLREPDLRTEHEAMPPILGSKYSANLWLHQHDFRGPNTHGCDLSAPMKQIRYKNMNGSYESAEEVGPKVEL